MLQQNQNEEKILKEFDELISSGRIHLNFGHDMAIEDLSDEEKINIMNYIKKIEERESKQN